LARSASAIESLGRASTANISAARFRRTVAKKVFLELGDEDLNTSARSPRMIAIRRSWVKGR
jgi:hypothetical protein